MYLNFEKKFELKVYLPQIKSNLCMEFECSLLVSEILSMQKAF